MERKGNIFFLIGLLAVMLAVIVTSWGERSLEAKLLPVVLGGLVIVLSAMELVRMLIAGRRPVVPEAASDIGISFFETEEVSGSLGAYAKEGVWVVVFVVAAYVLGFVLSTPILVFTYMKTHGGSWFGSAAYAIGTGVCIWGLFDVLLKLTLYRGELLIRLGI